MIERRLPARRSRSSSRSRTPSSRSTAAEAAGLRLGALARGRASRCGARSTRATARTDMAATIHASRRGLMAPLIIVDYPNDSPGPTARCRSRPARRSPPRLNALAVVGELRARRRHPRLASRPTTARSRTRAGRGPSTACRAPRAPSWTRASTPAARRDRDKARSRTPRATPGSTPPLAERLRARGVDAVRWWAWPPTTASRTRRSTPCARASRYGRPAAVRGSRSGPVTPSAPSKSCGPGATRGRGRRRDSRANGCSSAAPPRRRRAGAGGDRGRDRASASSPLRLCAREAWDNDALPIGSGDDLAAARRRPHVRAARAAGSSGARRRHGSGYHAAVLALLGGQCGASSCHAALSKPPPRPRAPPASRTSRWWSATAPDVPGAGRTTPSTGRGARTTVPRSSGAARRAAAGSSRLGGAHDQRLVLVRRAAAGLESSERTSESASCRWSGANRAEPWPRAVLAPDLRAGMPVDEHDVGGEVVGAADQRGADAVGVDGHAWASNARIRSALKPPETTIRTRGKPAPSSARGRACTSSASTPVGASSPWRRCSSRSASNRRCRAARPTGRPERLGDLERGRHRVVARSRRAP